MSSQDTKEKQEDQSQSSIFGQQAEKQEGAQSTTSSAANPDLTEQ